MADNPDVLDWFGRYLELEPGKTTLGRPDFYGHRLTKHEKELIAYVMNNVNVLDKMTESEQRASIGTQVHIRSSASLALAEIQRQSADVTAALQEPLRSEMQGLLQRLQEALDRQEPPNGEVDDLLFLLRGLRLIDAVNRLKNDYYKKYIDSRVRTKTLNKILNQKDKLAWMLQEKEQDYIKSTDELQGMLNELQSEAYSTELVNRQTMYSNEVRDHAYDTKYVEMYVDKCSETLLRRITALNEVISKYKTNLRDELDLFKDLQRQLKPSRKADDDDGSVSGNPTKYLKSYAELANIASFRLRLSS